MFSCKSWTSTKFVRSELTVELWLHLTWGEMILKSISQTKQKSDSLVLSRSYLWMVWRWHGIPHVYCYYFCLKLTLRKGTWVRTTPVTVMVIFFSKVVFWKLLDHSYIQSLFSLITRHLDKSILQDTLISSK